MEFDILGDYVVKKLVLIYKKYQIEEIEIENLKNIYRKYIEI